MKLYEKILQKSEINERFRTAVIDILRQELISSKAGLAESLQIKPAKFSEILNGRMNVGTDTLALMCDFYRISPDWLLMGRGNNMFRKDLLPRYWVEDEDHPLNTTPNIIEDPVQQNSTDESSSNNDEETIHLQQRIADKDALIASLQKQVANLEELIAMLRK
jgi:transcriptional regulator with XRE-family HTH domain